LGGGIVPGSLTLIGGDPGIGKSTLCLHLANSLGAADSTILYVSGEESLEQIAMRAKRLSLTNSAVLFSNETEVSTITKYVAEYAPRLVVIDSIQIVYKNEVPSSPGSVTQVRECTAALMQCAKSLHVAILIIGHVTKSGEIAGPRMLEHLVDTVLYFEGDAQQNLRLVRSIKNRFGPTDEIAVFQMEGGGLREVKNPSKLFIEDRTKGTTGTVIMPLMEGTRPILIEAQALVTDSYFENPSRRCTGLDPNRLALLLAVCEKRARFRLHRSDVFVSVTGGIKVTEPAADLGLLLAIVSSFSNKPFSHDTAVIGEVGLSGEIRGVSRIEARVKEALQMGFSRCIVPAKNAKALEPLQSSISIHPVRWIDEAIESMM
jgi:DNA repair protein RadA/Sms